MSKFIVIKFKNILYLLIVTIIILIIFCFFHFFIFNNTSTFSSILSQNSPMELDLDGDIIKDKINIIENNGFIQLKINTLNDTYLLKSSENDPNLFNIYTWYSLKPYFIDLNRDNINDFIISGLSDNKIKNYIFKWSNDCFLNIYSSNKNVIGILNSKNSRSPIILDADITKTNSTNSFILLSDSLRDISKAHVNIPALDTTEKFIDLIEYPYEILETPDIFSNYIDSSELSLLWKLDKSSYHYTYINSFFHDTDWDENGNPSSLLWTLSFKKTNILDSKAPEQEFILHIKTDLNELSQYKISSIQK